MTQAGSEYEARRSGAVVTAKFCNVLRARVELRCCSGQFKDRPLSLAFDYDASSRSTAW